MNRLPASMLSLTLALVLSLAGISPASPEIKPAQPVAAQDLHGPAIPDTAFEGVRYISTAYLEDLFGKEGSWVPDRQKYVVLDKAGRRWTFTLDNPYMNVGDEVLNLGFPVRRGPDRLYLPASSLLRILKDKVGQGVSLPLSLTGNTRSEGKDQAPAKPVSGGRHILEASVEDRENGTLVSVRTDSKLEVDTYWVPPHFILKFEQGRLASGFPTKAPGKGLVKTIQAVQEKGVAQVTLNIPKAIDTVEMEYSEETSTYLITVRKKTSKKPATEPVAAKPGKAKQGMGTVIIDPGHGGRDQGAQVAGINEAQITLAVGHELKAHLDKLGYRAIMTRETDEYVSLQERPKFASNKGGDLFVSLHCNSIGGSAKRKQSVSGHVAYILREGESEEDKALARRENQAISEESGKGSKGEISPVEWILLEHQLNLYSKESEAFAEQVIRDFGDFPIGKYGTGAGQAGFYVLVGAYMPAMLFEMGFLTHDRDRRFMASSKGQKKIAQTMAQAIHKYLSSRSPVRESGRRE